MADINPILEVLMDVTEKAKAAAEVLYDLAEKQPENGEKLIEARRILIAQNKLLRITVEALIKHEDQREEILRLFEERM